MSKETIEIPLRKVTYEELREVICELQIERCVKDKEIDRLNKQLKWDYKEINRLRNITNELEKMLMGVVNTCYTDKDIRLYEKWIKELKEKE